MIPCLKGLISDIKIPPPPWLLGMADVVFYGTCPWKFGNRLSSD